jgi:hypothetical protein
MLCAEYRRQPSRLDLTETRSTVPYVNVGGENNSSIDAHDEDVGCDRPIRGVRFPHLLGF